MYYFRVLLVVALCVVPSLAFGGRIYSMVVEHEGKTTEFKVQIGGSERTEVWTAFDPVKKAFVHLKFERGGAEPKPVGEFWDSKTGETVKLYQFEKSILPRIEKIEDVKVCPFTGSRMLRVESVIAID